MVALFLMNCSKHESKPDTENKNLQRAQMLLDSLYKNYSAPNIVLLRETYPFDNEHTATYLASEAPVSAHNQYSYLWPYSGTFSAVNALIESDADNKEYLQILENKVLSGLEEYFDTKRTPFAYSSYIKTASLSDRFYDDNVWLGIDYTDTYMMLGDEKYLDKAKLIWTFILSGIDEKLGGGIYWCEQKKNSKNTCSNAPGSVYAFKLFQATGDSSYFDKGKELYEWTKKNLQDSTDYLYFDYVDLDGQIGKAKFAYNSGQMMQAAALQYKLTNDSSYLIEAQNIAKSCNNHFFHEFKLKEEENFRLINKGDIWFTAVMLRGFIELYHLDNNKEYLQAFDKSLDYAWKHSRDKHGLFNVDLSGEQKDDKKWLLTQAAIVEMLARLSVLNL